MPHLLSKVLSQSSELRWLACTGARATSSGGLSPHRRDTAVFPRPGRVESSSSSITAGVVPGRRAEKCASVRVGNESGDVSEARSSLTHRFPRTVSAFHLH